MQRINERVRLHKATPYTEIRGSKLNHVLSWPARLLICALAVMLFLGMSNPGQTARLGRASLSQLAAGGAEVRELKVAGLAELTDYYSKADALVNALDTAAEKLEKQSDELLAAIGARTMDKARIASDNTVAVIDAADAALNSTLRAEINAFEATLDADLTDKLDSYAEIESLMKAAGEALEAMKADPANDALMGDAYMAISDATTKLTLMNNVEPRLKAAFDAIGGLLNEGLDGAQVSTGSIVDKIQKLKKAEVEQISEFDHAYSAISRLKNGTTSNVAMGLTELRTILAEAAEENAVENATAKLSAYDNVLEALVKLDTAMSSLWDADPEAKVPEGEEMLDLPALLNAYNMEVSNVEYTMMELLEAVPELYANNSIYSRMISKAITPDNVQGTMISRMETLLPLANDAIGENHEMLKVENDRLMANKMLAQQALAANSAALAAVEGAVAAARESLNGTQEAVDAAGDAMKLLNDTRVTDYPEKLKAANEQVDATVPVANEHLTTTAEALRDCAAALIAAKEPSTIAGAELAPEQTDALVNYARVIMAATMVGLVGMVMSLGNNRMRKTGLLLLFAGAGVSVAMLLMIKGAHADIALHVQQLREAHGLAELSEEMAAAVNKLALDVPDALLVQLVVAALAALFALLSWLTLPRKTEELMQIDLQTIFQRLTRVLVVVTGMLVFLPNLNPGRVSVLINENASLFTMAISYETIVEKLDLAISYDIINSGVIHTLMAGAAVVVLGILLNSAGACMSLGNNRMKKKGGYLLPMAGSAAILMGLLVIFTVHNTFVQEVLEDSNDLRYLKPMMPDGLIFWAVAAVLIFISSFVSWYLLPEELEEKMEMEEKYRNFLMFLPVLLMTFIFCYLPIWGWRFAFFDYKIGDQMLLYDNVVDGVVADKSNYVGLKWFTYLFENPANRADLVRVLQNTLIMSGLGIATSWLPIAFAVLLAEVRSSKFQRTVQTLTTIPNFISWVLVYAIAFAIFSTDGFINSFLRNILGITGANTDYLASADWIWVKMLLWGTWKGLGWSAIVYIAGIAGIDQQLYEAARVDGANRFQCIRHITIPGLIPTYMVMLLMSVAGMLSNGMDQYLVFENAINKDVIEVLDLYVYNIGIKSGLIPLSTVVGVFKSLIGVTLLFGANGISKAVRGESII